ncbi:hypothetical protein HMPREF1352_03151 [Enterococcus faecium 511]|nr:hypothetical protein HMPREF1352_03151 [Enterococcus faecium 511]EJY50799.1 hypothetical protein HMPREF1346_02336 [Enterococcus faecium 503]EPI23805.1 hypothetical protein D352_00963 [Enterococcus faecium LA4B-2]
MTKSISKKSKKEQPLVYLSKQDESSNFKTHEQLLFFTFSEW